MSNSDREQRLAAKLRENLKRRKTQAKARSSAPASILEEDATETPGTGDAVPPETARKTD